MAARTTWPKSIPPLTAEQQWISNDFLRHWLEVLPKKYSVLDRFNHGYPVRASGGAFTRTLEIGAGLGEHMKYEQLTPAQEANYYALELRESISRRLREQCPRINVITGDCQQRLDFPDGYFDRMLAIHVLEHLPDLPAALRELHRVCDKEKGRFHIVIPCEGGLAYTLARRISSQRIFEKRYKQPFKWFISREHLNLPREILRELAPYFRVASRRFFPIPLPLVFCNLVIGLTLVPR